MTALHHDILVAGGGIAGLTAAAAFGAAGFSVLCVDPAPPVTEREAAGADLRTTAFLQPARALLERAGLWARLEAHAMPLQTMRIMDISGEMERDRTRREFDSADISDAPFGWNLPNWLLRREMAARLEEMPGVSFRPGVAAETLFTRRGEARVRLSDGDEARVRLVLAADGRNSPMRRQAGIAARTLRFGQKALAFAVTHPVPHENVSTEIHLKGGPFTLVPLPDHEGRPSSAVVWMEDGREALRLRDLPVEALEATMTARSGGLLGPLTLASQVTLWPIISQVADRFAGERVALVAEAAHVVPPIGAQGLNMSLADLAALLELAEARPEGLGDAEMLAAYDRKRALDVRMRVAGVSMLNGVSMLGGQPFAALRARGIGALHDIAPVRRGLMRLGLGAGNVPGA